MALQTVPLTRDLIGAMLVVGGVETSENTNGGSHPESSWLFLRPDSGCISPLRREGGEYKTLRGNKPARKLTVGSSSGFQPPATMAAVESLSGGACNARQRSFDMAANGTSASALTLSDLNTTVNHEPRILDLRIAERLGMGNPRSIRETIEANRAELERYGSLSVVPTNPRKKGGRPGREFYLNEPQTVLLCMLSRTERAADVRQEVIEVFMAYRRGELAAPAKALSLADMDRARRMVAECRKLHGPRAAQKMWRELGLPDVTPDQPALPAPASSLEDGHAVVRLGDKVLVVDLHQRIWRRGQQVLAVDCATLAPVRLFKDAGFLHGRGGEVKVGEIRGSAVVRGVTILGQVIDVKEG